MLPHGRRSPALLSQYSRQQGAGPLLLLSPHQAGSSTSTAPEPALYFAQGRCWAHCPGYCSLWGPGPALPFHVPEAGSVGVRVGCGDGMFPSSMSSHDIPERGRGCFLAFISTGRLSWAPPASRVCSSVHLRHGVGTSLPSAPVAEGQGQFFLLLQQWGVGPILCSPIFSGLSGSRSRWLW